MLIGKIRCEIISAGNWLGDAGATLGVMPKPLWQKFFLSDEKNRIKLALNLLLLQTDDLNILIDTGIGNKITPKIQKIYAPTRFSLLEELQQAGLERNDINIVILTHLHFDHAGGVVSNFDGKLELTFPAAMHLIQKKEWEIAKKPDELNSASYDFVNDLALLEKTGNYKLLNGNYKITPEISCELVGGHSDGMQIVRIESEDQLAYYAGDIIPLEIQKHLAVTSAFDICRKDTFKAKKKILTELKERKGILFLDHDDQQSYLSF